MRRLPAAQLGAKHLLEGRSPALPEVCRRLKIMTAVSLAPLAVLLYLAPPRR